MNELILSDVVAFIEANIGPGFHDKKIKKVQRLTLNDILRRKNPYLYKAKAVLDAHDYISAVLDATASSAEETIFGNFMERVAIFVCEKVYKGRKSTTKGLDLEFEHGNAYHFIAIKSGPSWGNSGQIEALKSKFVSAQKTLRTSGGGVGKQLVFVEACYYGVDDAPDKGTHLKLCGQRFWEFISGGNRELFRDIIEPLGHKAHEKTDELKLLYSAKLNDFTGQFINRFCDNGIINWDRLVIYNSGDERQRPSILSPDSSEETS